jgi:hypothetical protein
VQHLPNGSIVQILDSQLASKEAGKREIDRVYLAKGVVARHFANHNCEVLFPNGDFATFDRSTLEWTLTN